MNVVFISPQFPETYWMWCDRLRRDGACVMGIGDTPYDAIPDELKGALVEYYYCPSLEDYDAVFRAMAFLSFKHGKIDWVESQNDYWLPLDARLRDDFNIRTGASFEQMSTWQSKAGMKPLYAAAGVPSARQLRARDLEGARAFAREVGWPLFAKPERGVGAGGAFSIPDDEALEAFFAGGTPRREPYVLEEFVTGEICSYDAIVDSTGEPLFENQEEFPPSMEEVKRRRLDISYLSRPDVDERLAERGRAVTRAFGITSRFVHQEFFRLTQDKPGLGAAGDYVGLEVNLRPPGGYSPDMMNYAHSTDVYQIWADMVCFDERRVPRSDDQGFCVYCSRRDLYRYRHGADEVRERFGDAIRQEGRVPQGLSDDLGNSYAMARFKTQAEVDAFREFVQERA